MDKNCFLASVSARLQSVFFRGVFSITGNLFKDRDKIDDKRITSIENFLVKATEIALV